MSVFGRYVVGATVVNAYVIVFQLFAYLESYCVIYAA